MEKLNYLWILVFSLASCESAKEKVNNYVNKAQEQDILHGVVLVVHDKDTLSYSVNGKSDYNRKIDNVISTKYCLASVTKLFTEVALLRLVDNKEVALEDPINNYLPQLPEWSSRVTLWHLLSMTSGLPRELHQDSESSTVTFDKNGYVNLLTDSLNQIQPMASPGEKVQYSNLGFWLLGAIMEKVRGKPINDVMREVLFNEIGMSNSGILTFSGQPANLAIGYSLDANGNKEVNTQVDAAARYTSGGGYSTIEDMMKLAMSLKQPGLLSEGSWRQLYNISEDAANQNEKHTSKNIEVYGSLPNFTNFYISDLDEQLLIISLNNIGINDLNEVMKLKSSLYEAMDIKWSQPLGRNNKIIVDHIDSLSDDNVLEAQMKIWIGAVLTGDEKRIYEILSFNGASAASFNPKEPDWLEIAAQKEKMQNFRVAGYRWVEDELPKGIEVWFVSDTEAKIGFLWIPNEENPHKLDGIMIKPVDTEWLGKDY